MNLRFQNQVGEFDAELPVRRKSDIDVMIKVAESNPEIEAQIDNIIFEINLHHDSFISAIIFSRKEVEEGPLAKSPLYKIIQREELPI